jgi:hypothetical protein
VSEIRFIGIDKVTHSSFLLEVQGDDIFLAKLDSLNRLQFTKKINLVVSPELQDVSTVFVYDVRMLKDKFVFLIEAMDKNKTLAKFFVQDLSLEGEYISSALKIAEVEEDTESNHYINFEVSPDLSKVLVAIGMLRKGQSLKNKLFIRTIDQDLDLLESKDIHLGVKDQPDIMNILLNDWVITNEGDVYVLGEKISYQFKSSAYSIWVIKFLSNSLEEIKVELGVYWIYKAVLKINTSNEVMTGGFYYGKSTSSKLPKFQGAFYGLVKSKNNSNIIFKTVELDSQLEQYPLGAFVDEKFIDAEVKEDGGIFLMSEPRYISKGFHLGSLLIINFEREGALKFICTVPKAQIQSVFDNTGATSYFATYDNTTKVLKIIYNDHLKNLYMTNQKPRALVHIKKSIPVMVSIDSNGKMNKVALTNGSVNEIVLIPTACFFSSDQRILTIGKDIKKKQLVMGNVMLP